MQDSYNEFFFQVDKPYNPLFIDFVLSLGVEAVEEKNGGVFVRSNDDLSTIAWAVDKFGASLAKHQNITLNLRTNLSQKPNKDWIIGDFYIHSSWQKPNLRAINVQIDPALAFGSGHHESTHSCIELLQAFAKSGDKALDIGCGSGILSIILAKMGCEVSACDTDEIAVSSTLSNAKLNQIALKELWQGSVNQTKALYDIVVANLVGDIILTLAFDLKARVKKGGYLVLAGILDKYKARIQREFKEFKQIKQSQTNEWLSFVYQKENK